MHLNFNLSLAKDYKSPSQKIRILSEDWVESSIYCPNCGSIKIVRCANNNPVLDFYCKSCLENYELKSKKDVLGDRVLDGAYQTKIERLSSNKNPNLFLLVYKKEYLEISDFIVVPKHFFIPKIVEKRKPLSSSARRAGWVGSNILLSRIPQFGKIFYVKNGKIEVKESVLSSWKKTVFLRKEKDFSTKGWLLDIMGCIEKLNKKEFTLNEMYSFEGYLSVLHPENRHIKEKIRQQLQILRDNNYIDFSGKGKYRLE